MAAHLLALPQATLKAGEAPVHVECSAYISHKRSLQKTSVSHLLALLNPLEQPGLELSKVAPTSDCWADLPLQVLKGRCVE